MKIVKFKLDFGDNLIDYPNHLDPLQLGYEGDSWVVWCLERRVVPRGPLELRLVATGQEFGPDLGFCYVGTASNFHTATTFSTTAHLLAYTR